MGMEAGGPQNSGVIREAFAAQPDRLGLGRQQVHRGQAQDTWKLSLPGKRAAETHGKCASRIPVGWPLSAVYHDSESR